MWATVWCDCYDFLMVRQCIAQIHRLQNEQYIVCEPPESEEGGGNGEEGGQREGGGNGEEGGQRCGVIAMIF